MRALFLIGMLLWTGMAEAKELRFLKDSKNVNQLHDELLVAFPAWKGVLRPDGIFENPKLHVESSATEIILTVPDGTTEASVQAVIAAHVPKAPLPDPQAELEAAISSATTLQELKDALVGKIKSGKAEARRP